MSNIGNLEKSLQEWESRKKTHRKYIVVIKLIVAMLVLGLTGTPWVISLEQNIGSVVIDFLASVGLDSAASLGFFIMVLLMAAALVFVVDIAFFAINCILTASLFSPLLTQLDEILKSKDTSEVEKKTASLNLLAVLGLGKEYSVYVVADELIFKQNPEFNKEFSNKSYATDVLWASSGPYLVLVLISLLIAVATPNLINPHMAESAYGLTLLNFFVAWVVLDMTVLKKTEGQDVVLKSSVDKALEVLAENGDTVEIASSLNKVAENGFKDFWQESYKPVLRYTKAPRTKILHWIKPSLSEKNIIETFLISFALVVVLVIFTVCKLESALVPLTNTEVSDITQYLNSDKFKDARDKSGSNLIVSFKLRHRQNYQLDLVVLADSDLDEIATRKEDNVNPCQWRPGYIPVYQKNMKTLCAHPQIAEVYTKVLKDLRQKEFTSK